MRNMKLGATCLLLAPVTALALLAGCPAASKNERALARVEEGEIECVIRVTGSLGARTSTNVRSDLQEEAKVIFLAPEGSTAAKGDVLVKLDPTELAKRAEELDRQIKNAEVQLEVADAEYRIQLSEGENQLSKAKLQVDQALKELEKYRDGEAPIQEKKLDVTVQETLSERDRAKVKFEQMPKLLEEGFVTASQVEEERIRLRKAEVAWQSAVGELELFRKYTLPMEVERKETAVSQARSDLEAVKMRAESQLKQRLTVKQQHEETVASYKRLLAETVQNIEKTVIRAPAAGLVIYGGMSGREWRDDEEIKVGSRVWPHNTLITLPDLSEMDLTVRIHESDINRISAGGKCDVLVESKPGRTFTGRVTKIADLASTGGWRSDPNVKMFEVTIALDGRDLGLKPGTTADALLFIDRKEKALRLPLTAVHGKPGEYYCFVETFGSLKKRDLRLGLAGESFVEVLEGLAKDEMVLLGPPPEEWETKKGAPEAKAGEKKGK